MKILRLDKAGVPISWVSKEDAVTLLFRNEILWEIGDRYISISGGTNRQGNQSRVMLPPVIASTGTYRKHSEHVPLDNKSLFRRDEGLCMYCGKPYYFSGLTRDHVKPRVQGGLDIWSNVVACCYRCNNIKGGRTPEQAGMPLRAIPFEPNIFEYMYLREHKILGDQMDYLKTRFSGRRDWFAA